MKPTAVPRSCLFAFALVFLTLLAYWPALHGGFIWDDDDHLTANAAVAAPGGLRLIWSSLKVSRYYPLTLTTFWGMYRLCGLNPLPYHALNILLHGFSAVLLWLILLKLRVPGAWAAAAIWAVHPVNVESVAWVTELKNTQSGFLFFLSLLFWLRSKTDPESVSYRLALLCFATALLSKTSTVVLPLVLLLIAWWRNERWRRRDLLNLIPFVALATGMALLTIVEQRGQIQRTGGEDWTLSIPQRLVLAGWDMWFYAGKLLCPLNLNFVYPRWKIADAGLTAFLPLLGAVGIALTLWACRRRAAARGSAFGLGYYVIALLPVLGLANVFYFRYSFVADHFQYLAGAGAIALAVAAGTTVLRQGAPRTVAAGIVIAVLAIVSWQRCAVFHDEASLWRDTLANNPGAWMAHNNLGTLLKKSGHKDAAFAEYEQAVRINPDDANAQVNLGTALMEDGKLAGAVTHFEQAVKVNPSYVIAHNSLGVALLNLGKPTEATAEFQRALQLDPHSADARSNLELAARQSGQSTNAPAAPDNADSADYHFKLGLALKQAGHIEEAIAHYQRALQIAPNNPGLRINLGNALLQTGQTREAIAQYNEALRLAPDSYIAHFNLGNALLQEGRTQDAISHYEEAVRLKPDFAPAQAKLDQLRASP